MLSELSGVCSNSLISIYLLANRNETFSLLTTARRGK
jgi:hypothetical protein